MYCNGMSEKRRIAVYPGSFDPPTYGHVDIIKRSLPLFDKVIIAVLENPSKTTALFTPNERVNMLKEILTETNETKLITFKGLLVDCMSNFGANVIIRGLRFVSDFEYEMQMALMNHSLDARVETVFMVARPERTFVSSSLVKEVAKLGRDISPFVPPPVAKALKEKFAI